MSDSKSGAELIMAERSRQIVEENWTEDHDRKFRNRELTDAAISYILSSRGVKDTIIIQGWWPWFVPQFKPKSTIQDLIRAGALIAAEIDRINATAMEVGHDDTNL